MSKGEAAAPAASLQADFTLAQGRRKKPVQQHVALNFLVTLVTSCSYGTVISVTETRVAMHFFF